MRSYFSRATQINRISPVAGSWEQWLHRITLDNGIDNTHLAAILHGHCTNTRHEIWKATKFIDTKSTKSTWKRGTNSQSLHINRGILLKLERRLAGKNEPNFKNSQVIFHKTDASALRNNANRKIKNTHKNAHPQPTTKPRYAQRLTFFTFPLLSLLVSRVSFTILPSKRIRVGEEKVIPRTTTWCSFENERKWPKFEFEDSVNRFSSLFLPFHSITFDF